MVSLAGLLPTKAFNDVALQFASDHTAHRNKLMEAVKCPLGGTPAGIDGLGTFRFPPRLKMAKRKMFSAML
jgi:hypothetical protein